MTALDGNSVEFVIIDEDVGALRVFVAATLVLALDRITGHLVDKLLPQPIAGLLIDLPERDPLGG
jgi:hypothetical protein